MAGLAAVKDVVSIAGRRLQQRRSGRSRRDHQGGSCASISTRRARSSSRTPNCRAASSPRPYGSDYDHDYDLDLVLLGEKSALLRNNGAAGFSDETAAFPFVKGKPLDAVHFDLIPDTDASTWWVAYADRPGVLYRDKLMAKFEAIDLPQVAAGTRALAAADVDNDSTTDLILAGPAGAPAGAQPRRQVRRPANARRGRGDGGRD